MLFDKPALSGAMVMHVSVGHAFPMRPCVASSQADWEMHFRDSEQEMSEQEWNSLKSRCGLLPCRQILYEPVYGQADSKGVAGTDSSRIIKRCDSESQRTLKNVLGGVTHVRPPSLT